MKKITSILIGLLILGFAYIGYDYYKNRQLKETYKTALVTDLEQAYRRIFLQELDSTKKMILEPFAFSTEDEINGISTKYANLLLKLETGLYDLENATKNALKELDPSNKLLVANR